MPRPNSDRRSKVSRCRPQDGAGSAASVSGKTYVFRANDRKLETITLQSDAKDGTITLVAKIDGSENRIACGRGQWQKGRFAWGKLAEQPVAASGAWTADDTFTARLCFYETPFIVSVQLTFFSGEEVRFSAETNVGFGLTTESPLVGSAK